MTKAVFFDIDGTLVPFHEHGVPESAKMAIHEIRQQGVKVFICTGRPLQYVDNLDGVEYDGMVTVTGALCTDQEGRAISETCIPRQDVQDLLDYLEAQENPMPFVAISQSQMYANACEREDVQRFMKNLNIPPYDYQPLAQASQDHILQLTGFFKVEEEAALKQNILKHCLPMRWHESFADVVAEGVSKSTGIDKMIAHYGIDLSETMAFGDGGNDIPMLEHAAVSVVMGNASDAVKQYADYVTTDVDKDGVSNALRHFGLIQ